MGSQNENVLEEILSFNQKFVQEKQYQKYETTKNPAKKIVILSCMDTRLTELLPRALNIKNGDAKIIKNAGATMIHPFGSIARSLIVAIYEFKVKDILVVGHHGCGMSTLNSSVVVEKMKLSGISEEVINTVSNSGIDVKKWLRGFESVEQTVKESVHSIRNHPFVPEDVRVHGLIMDPYTGEVECVDLDDKK